MIVVRTVLAIVLVAAASLALIPAHASGPPALVIGDSISLGAAPYLEARGIEVNAVVGRQFVTGIAVARSLPLPSHVVVELGTNGPITRSDVRAMLGVLHPRRRSVSFVTCYVSRDHSWSIAYQWCGSGLGYGVNAVLAWASRVWPRVHLVRWDRAVSRHPSWIACDGVHPCTAAGEAAFVNPIARSV